VPNVILLDFNRDLLINEADGLAILTYLFLDGPPPAQGKVCAPISGCPDVCTPF
jgi:hypothetical protein